MDRNEALSQYFGYSTFRDGQEVLLDALLSGRDAMGILPTGAGKSLCYQLPAVLLEGITLVVSPLISLMRDQVFALKAAGIPAAYINSSLTASQQLEALRRAEKGQYKIIYAAPERLMSERFCAFARNASIALIAIDEAHCISQWGQDFRPAYLQIPRFISALPKRPPVGAFTATATPQVRGDILRLLDLHAPALHIGRFDRPNLSFSVLHPQNENEKNALLLDDLHAHPDESGIVYCSTRRAVEDIYSLLAEEGIKSARYHAGLSEEERSRSQEAFRRDRIRVMVATNAFGMGIDKPNVRFVIHYNLPCDLESYYQEAGRAGRDGKKARCLLLYSGRDVHTLRYLIEQGSENSLAEEGLLALKKAGDLERLRRMCAYASTRQCLRKSLLNYFGEHTPQHCGNCSYCQELRTTPPASAPREPGLFGDLRDLRDRIARCRCLPPNRIFSDDTLRQMVERLPQTVEELAALVGADEVRSQRYGDDFLMLLRIYRRNKERLPFGNEK